VGHCGVAIGGEKSWLMHAGDSYYRRVEVDVAGHPISAMAQRFAADNAARLDSLEKLRHLAANQDLEFFSAHDYNEYRSAENPLNAALAAAS
jgi:glyoxylase-like metal-dependent hydrolase (beta-lactamase superfamily II)